MNYKLSPSGLTFLYEGCKRCFYLKTKYNIAQPSIPLPAIFSKIAGLLKEYYDGKRTDKLHEDLPPGIVKYGEEFVKSDRFDIPRHNDTCFIYGRFDIVIEFDDGSFGIIDFKTGNPKSEYSDLYSRQLHAYAYALENPSPNSIKLSPVSFLGLLYFYPSKVSQENVEWLSYDSKISLIEIKKNDQNFLKFIEEVLGLLESKKLPPSDPQCYWCKYGTQIRNLIK